MKNLFSKLFLAGALAGLVISPVAAHAKTRAETSPVFANAAGLMQAQQASTRGSQDDGRTRDGRTWDDDRGAWVDGKGDYWLLDDGKWYPLRGKLLPALFLAGISAIAYFAVTRDRNQSPGAN